MSRAEEKLLRVKDAGELAGLEPDSMRIAEKHGLIVAVRDWAGHRRFKESAVLEFRRKLLAGELHVQEPRVNVGRGVADLLASESGSVLGLRGTKKSESK
jgi:hypothetical protein